MKSQQVLRSIYSKVYKHPPPKKISCLDKIKLYPKIAMARSNDLLYIILVYTCFHAVQ